MKIKKTSKPIWSCHFGTFVEGGRPVFSATSYASFLTSFGVSPYRHFSITRICSTSSFSASSFSTGLCLPSEISPGVCTLLFKWRHSVLRGTPCAVEARLIGMPSRIASSAALNLSLP